MYLVYLIFINNNVNVISFVDVSVIPFIDGNVTSFIDVSVIPFIDHLFHLLTTNLFLYTNPYHHMLSIRNLINYYQCFILIPQNLYT